MYFDVSRRKENARFTTPSNINSYKCLKFYYHMTGMHVGRLNVYATNNHGNEELLWRLFGEQNNTWNEASIPVNAIYPQYQVNNDMPFCCLIVSEIKNRFHELMK